MRAMILLKSCPRCAGDLVMERLPGATEVVCLQCSYRTDFRPQTRPTLAAPVVRKAA